MKNDAADAPLAPQIPPATAEDRWHHVREAIPELHQRDVEEETDTVLLWCLKSDGVFAGRLVIESEGPMWHTRSLDGTIIADFHRHERDVCHWRPVPRKPSLTPCTAD